MNIETFDYNTESWVGEAISKGMRRHKNVKCFNCGRIHHLKGVVDKEFLGIISPLGMAKIGELSLHIHVEGVAKADIESMNTKQTKRQTRQPDTIGKLLEWPLTGPKAKGCPVIPSHCGGHVSPGKLKIQNLL